MFSVQVSYIDLRTSYLGFLQKSIKLNDLKHLLDNDIENLDDRNTFLDFSFYNWNLQTSEPKRDRSIYFFNE